MASSPTARPRATLKGMQRLWVVEMLVDYGRWEPTVGCGLCREEARQEVIKFREANPADEFRVREYRPYASR